MNVIRKVVLLSTIQTVLSARILGVFPTPSISHQVVFQGLSRALAERGHDLVVITTDTMNSPNITEINTHNASYTMWNIDIRKFINDQLAGRSLCQNFDNSIKIIGKMFETAMEAPEVQSLMKNHSEHFDLILVEHYVRPAYAFQHKFKAPLIAVSSFSTFAQMYNALGIPTHPVLYPDAFGNKVSDFSLMDTIDAIYNFVCLEYYSKYGYGILNDLARKYFGEDTPDIEELELQTDMLFLNVNPIWDGIRPIPPSVIYMGGSHLKVRPAKELPADLRTFFDNSTRGVVYVSLGSNVKSSELPPGKLQVFLEALGNVPYDVLWKWENDELPGKPDNVKVSKWLPQTDLLKHPKLKVFVTQGGLQSSDEAMEAGVPVVGIPAFGDQFANVDQFRKHGVGIALNFQTLTAAQLENAINRVAEDKRYRENMKRMSRLLADQPMTGLERAVWWTEHVLRHGGAKHLRSPAAGISYARYFMLDVAAVVFSTLAALVLVITLSLRCATSFVNSYNVKIKNS